MKSKNLFCFILLATLLLSSCANDENVESFNPDQFLDNLIVNNPDHYFEVLKGNVVFENSRENFLSIFIEKDRLLTHFFLQYENVSPSIDSYNGAAIIAKEDKSLLLLPYDGHKPILLTIEESTLNFPKKSNLTEFNGIGLGKQILEQTIATRDLSDCSCSCETGDVECNKGGPTENSCEDSSGPNSCTVSCQGEKFACCNCGGE